MPCRALHVAARLFECPKQPAPGHQTGPIWDLRPRRARALDLVPDYLLSTFAAGVKVLFHDIFQSYIRAMKVAIMDYILRSPDERKRLHILMLPHKVLTAAERQWYAIQLMPLRVKYEQKTT